MEKQLPKNWVETGLNTIILYVIGGDWGKDPESINDDDYIEVLCIRGSEIKNWNKNKGNTASLRKIKKSSLANRKLQIGDILLEISGGGPDQPVGRTVFIDKDVLNFELKIDKVCTNFLRLVRIYDIINSSYINNYLQYFYNSGEIVKYQGGSNNLRNLKFKEYENISIPLPPLAEQNRIVAKLDTLFAQLETIKASMAKVPLLLKEFRQQVLTQAVTGKLTEEWRKGKELESAEFLFDKISKYYSGNKKRKIVSVTSENYSKIPKTWKKCFIGDISEVSNGSTPSRKEEKYWNGHIAWIGSSFIQNNRISQVNEFITEEGFKNSSVKILPKGTVLIAMIGEGKTRAQSAILDIEATINQNIAALNIEHGFVLPEFLQYYLISNYEKHRLVGNGTGPQALNGQKVREIEFILPPFQEQQEIVSRIESLFAKADAIEQQYKLLKDKIDTLPQALLHKAFKGELTEQLDSDGDARELLQQIQELKAATGKTVKSKTTKSVTKKVKFDVEKEGVLGMAAEPNNS